MAYNFKAFESRISEISDHLGKELASVRTGRANPAILDGVHVESYGSRVPISQIASMSVDDARSLRIVPWDIQNAKEIEKAITIANLGLSVSMDERGVRVFFPELTAERRQSLLKIAKEKVEASRTSLRVARDEIWTEIQSQERDGILPEDDKFRARDDMQKRVDAANKKFDEMLERKEHELSQ
jgi:ribosome recycling factor